ncbi:N-6 DNA methylase [Nonomuraea sp. NPDC050680]|uniref:N-6 DNA methylase n=1 Tax=Nonomuraea sp. NPDC050680 TaxID=3154630 RepID=UPI0033F3B32A
MQDSATVAAADIARLAGVGRAAVSNWRRRFDDFPAPVGGTSSSPLFSLGEIEEWLRRQGKLSAVPADERAWQQLRATVDDLYLGQALGEIGEFLVFVGASGTKWRRLAKKTDTEIIEGVFPGVSTVRVEIPILRAIADLAEEQGTQPIFDFLYQRYLEAHSRRIDVVAPEVAELMVALPSADNGTVLDPTCGLGTLLLTAAGVGATRLLGQEQDEAAARVAAARLRLHGHDATIQTGDALRDDRFGSAQADAVVCIPPFGERSWGYEELASDIRWQYGLPPRGEPELPWVQHGLFHLRPGRYMAVLMPQSAADRRSGRRIRAQLLRTGAIRSVITLPAGTAPGSQTAPHLWILRRPEPGDPTPTHVLMVDASHIPLIELPSMVLERWKAFQREPVAGAVPLIELLDEDVDLTPARYVAERREKAEAFPLVLERLHTSLADLLRAVESLRELAPLQRNLPMTTIAEQVRAGAITVVQAPKTQQQPGKIPVLTLEDVVRGGDPSGRMAATSDMVTVEPGDVVVSSGGRSMVARVAKMGGMALGPGLQLLRMDRERIDPTCLSGFLKLSGAQVRGQSGTSRSDIRRVEIPRVPLQEQRRLGAAFRRLETLEKQLETASEQGESLVSLCRAEVFELTE